MAFRILFLYAPKIVIPLFVVMLAAGFLPGTVGRSALSLGFWVMTPLGILGALTALYLLFVNSQLACPLCGAASDVQLSEKPGVHCPKCGHVYVTGPFARGLSVERYEDSGGE